MMTHHGLLYLVARIGSGLLSVATLAAFTRLLTPTEYGLYALGTTVAAIASTLLFQWLNISVGRFYPAHLQEPGILVAASRRGFMVAALAASAALLLALLFRDLVGVPSTLLVLVYLATLALGVYNLLLQIANAQGRPMLYALLTWFKAAALLGGGVALSLLWATHQSALLAFVAGHAIAAILANPLRGVRSVTTAATPALTAKLLGYGVPLMFTLAGTVAVDFADRLLIGWLLGAGRLGPYAAAYDLSTQSIGAITNIAFLAAFPAVMHAFEHHGEDAARTQLRSLGRALIAIGLPATVGFSVLSDDICNLFLGPSFRGEVAGIMPVLAASLWIGGFKCYYLDVVFQIRRITGHQARIALLMMAVNVGLNLLLLSRFGLLAAAWSTFAAFAVGAVLSFWLGRSRMRLLPIGGDFVKASAASGLMAASTFLPGHPGGVASLLVKVLVAAGVYAGAAWLLDLGEARSWLSRRLAR